MGEIEHGGQSHGVGEGHGRVERAEKQFKQTLFLVLIAALGIGLLIIFQNTQTILENIWWVALALIVIYAISKFDFLLQLREYERAVVFRLGRVNRVGGPGWALLFPPLEDYVLVDLRTKTIDTPKQEVITSDSIEVTIDAVVYLKVDKSNQSVINSVIEIDDYLKASELFVQALLRDKAASLTLSELLARIDDLNSILKKELERISSKWGVVVEEAVIQDIDIPKDVLEAMHEQKIAVQRKLARIERAQGHKAEIEAVMSAAENLNDRALAYYYVKALEKLGEGKSTKVIFPMELTNLAKSLSGNVGLSQQDVESMFKKYAPIVKSLAEKGKNNSKKK